MKEAIPGIVLSLAPIILLALVSFNTPLIKSLYFLKADYSGFSATFGTLGYCTTGGSAVTNGTAVDANGCVGPTVGYTFDPDTVFGLSNSLFDIPTVITKYLTYVLILHVCALCTGVGGLILNLLDLIPNVSLLCFPGFLTWLTSALALLAFIIDAIMFYIARARINSVSGAKAEIGYCVWLTLAAWVMTIVVGCIRGFGQCCAMGNKKSQRKARDDRAYEAMKQEQDARLQNQPYDSYGYGKRAGPPINPYTTVKEEEVSVPLTATVNHDDDEDKHLATLPYGSQVDGVGYGYGQRYPPQPQPRQITPPLSDRGYVPSATAYPTQPYPAQDPYADPYASRRGTEYLAQPATYQGNESALNLAPGLPGQRSMTPASTYAGSFVGVGSGRHDGLGMPGLPEGAMANVAAYGGAQQARQASGYDAPGGQQYTGYGGAQYAQQQGYPPSQEQNPYAAGAAILRPPSDPYEPRQGAYAHAVSTQDAYAAYEEPTSTTSAYQTNPYPTTTRSPPPPLAPQPHRIHTQGVNAPGFALEGGVTSPDQYAVVSRAQDGGPVDAPPMYEQGGGSGYPPPQSQPQNGYGRDNKAGYFN